MTGEASVWVLSNEALSDALQRVADGDSPTVVMAEIYANAKSTPVRPARGIWRVHERLRDRVCGTDAYCFRYYKGGVFSLHRDVPVAEFWSVAP